MATFKILKIKTTGIKNISKTIELIFSPLTTKNIIDSNNSPYIKSIYGQNGSGKTALIYSIYLYKNLVGDKDFLTKNKLLIENLINKTTKIFSIEVVFNANLEGTNLFFSHFVEIDTNFGMRISREKLSRIVSNSINGQQNQLFDIQDGKILQLDLNEEMASKVINKSTNLLLSSTLSSLMFPILRELLDNKEIDGSQKAEDNFFHLLLPHLFSNNIFVRLQNNDMPDLLSSESIEKQNSMLKGRLKRYNAVEHPLFINDEDKILKKDIGFYNSFIEKTSEFIKIFKHSLSRIEVKKIESVDSDYYICRKVFVYKSGVNNEEERIDFEFESTGIKNIFSLFSYIHAFYQGMCVFVDEFDANINGVFLEKLFDFMIAFGKGQFCFTSHNTSPMNVLKNIKHSIDFINDNGEIISWVNNSHYSPAEVYKNGYIEDLNFNISSLNFLKVFGKNK